MRPEAVTVPASTAAPPGRAAPTAATLIDTLLQIHRQTRLPGILEAATTGITRLGVPVHCGAFLRDGGSDAWYLASLVDPQGKAVPPSRHGIPDQPLAFRLPSSEAAMPLPLLFGSALDEEVYERMATTLAVGGGVCLPVTAGSEPSGALFALFASPESGPMVGALLAHAALATGRVLEDVATSGVRRVLDAAAFTDAAETELARCAAAGRRLSLIVCSAGSVAELAALGRGLLKVARVWDIAGRAPVEQPAVALLLPEVDRVDARLLLRKVDGHEHGGVATYPEEGSTLTRLVTVALSRTTVGDAAAPERAFASASKGWTRGLRVTPHADVLRCPGCNVAYTRLRPPGTPSPDDAGLRAVREALEAECPAHGPELDAER